MTKWHNWWSRYAERISSEAGTAKTIKLSAHSLRRQYARNLFDDLFEKDVDKTTACSFFSFSGTSDYVAKRLMGHSLNDSVTAGVYTHYNDDEILKAAKPYLDYVSLKLDKILEKPEAER